MIGPESRVEDPKIVEAWKKYFETERAALDAYIDAERAAREAFEAAIGVPPGTLAWQSHTEV